MVKSTDFITRMIEWHSEGDIPNLSFGDLLRHLFVEDIEYIGLAHARQILIRYHDGTVFNVFPVQSPIDQPETRFTDWLLMGRFPDGSVHKVLINLQSTQITTINGQDYKTPVFFVTGGTYSTGQGELMLEDLSLYNEPVFGTSTTQFIFRDEGLLPQKRLLP